jgi:hypothetical protein
MTNLCSDLLPLYVPLENFESQFKQRDFFSF